MYDEGRNLVQLKLQMKNYEHQEVLLLKKYLFAQLLFCKNQLTQEPS